MWLSMFLSRGKKLVAEEEIGTFLYPTACVGPRWRRLSMIRLLLRVAHGLR